MKINRTKIIARLRPGIFKPLLLLVMAGALASCCTVRPTTILYLQIPNQSTSDDSNSNDSSAPVQPSVIIIGFYTNILSAADSQGKLIGQVSAPGANAMALSSGGGDFIRIYVTGGQSVPNQNIVDKAPVKQNFSAVDPNQQK
jgi:hypothetical protein